MISLNPTPPPVTTDETKAFFSSRLFAIGLALSPLAAFAQQLPVNLPASTVFGRLANGPGPAQAIPFSVLLASIAGAQSPNVVYAGPASGSSASPAFRALVGADLPAPGASSLGGAESLTCAASNWFYTLATTGIFGCRQPAFSDLTGTFTAAQCIAATGSALGCVKPDGSTITIAAGVLTAVSGSAASVDAAGGTSVTNCGTSGAGLYNTSSSKVGCAPGQWQLLATLTASNSATLSDTTHITASYVDYEIVCHNLVPAATTNTTLLRIHNNGSFQTSGYSGQSWLPNSTAVLTNTWSGSVILTNSAGITNNSPGLNFRLLMSNPSSNDFHAFYGQGSYAVSGTPTLASISYGGGWATSGVIDGFQILESTGNITSGNCELYGRL